MPKQGKNIYLRKDGRWEGRYIKDRISGKTHYGYVFGKSYEEAEQKFEVAFCLKISTNPRKRRFVCRTIYRMASAESSSAQGVKHR